MKLTISILAAVTLCGQSKTEGITREQADAILAELRAIRALLEKQAGPAMVTIKLPPGIHMLGDPAAPLTMVEYIDFECPYCKTFDANIFPMIKKNMIDTGKLRYISRNFPLAGHADAPKAAEAAECAAEQNRFWEMRALLVAHDQGLSPQAISAYARSAGVNPAPFEQCLATSRHAEGVRMSTREGTAAGVQGTPSFVIGRTVPDGVAGTLTVGVNPYSTFEAEFAKSGR